MASGFSGKRQDDLNRFYTRLSVGDILVELLGDISPDNVLDLGAGEGILSAAVVKKWPQVASVTVDIDPSASENLDENLIASGSGQHHHHIENVLDPSLSIALAKYGLFDLAVCNPPFYRPAWNRDFARILLAAELQNACPSIADVTAEILFLAQNLTMLRDGGVVALIAPDGLITNWRTAPFRRAILANHSVEWVLQLPKHSFYDTEARCFILALKKSGGPTRSVKLLHYNFEAGLSEPILIEATDAVQRLDYNFHSNRHGGSHGQTTLRQLGADVKRGSISTAQRHGKVCSTFHTTDFRELIDGRLTINERQGYDVRTVIAAPGDILMARVDRSLHLKVAMVIAGCVAPTDCVYRVRLPKEYREVAFQALRSPAGSASLLSATKGVGARLLGKADLLDLPLNIQH